MALTPEQAARLKELYDEANKRGLFKKNPRFQEIGHELRKRGLIEDPTQGGLVAPEQPKQQPQQVQTPTINVTVSVPGATAPPTSAAPSATPSMRTPTQPVSPTVTPQPRKVKPIAAPRQTVAIQAAPKQGRQRGAYAPLGVSPLSFTGVEEEGIYSAQRDRLQQRGPLVADLKQRGQPGGPLELARQPYFHAAIGLGQRLPQLQKDFTAASANYDRQTKEFARRLKKLAGIYGRNPDGSIPLPPDILAQVQKDQQILAANREVLSRRAHRLQGYAGQVQPIFQRFQNEPMHAGPLTPYEAANQGRQGFFSALADETMLGTVANFLNPAQATTERLRVRLPAERRKLMLKGKYPALPNIPPERAREFEEVRNLYFTMDPVLGPVPKDYSGGQRVTNMAGPGGGIPQVVDPKFQRQQRQAALARMSPWQRSIAPILEKQALAESRAFSNAKIDEAVNQDALTGLISELAGGIVARGVLRLAGPRITGPALKLLKKLLEPEELAMVQKNILTPAVKQKVEGILGRPLATEEVRTGFAKPLQELLENFGAPTKFARAVATGAPTVTAAAAAGAGGGGVGAAAGEYYASRDWQRAKNAGVAAMGPGALIGGVTAGGMTAAAAKSKPGRAFRVEKGAPKPPKQTPRPNVELEKPGPQVQLPDGSVVDLRHTPTDKLTMALNYVPQDHPARAQLEAHLEHRNQRAQQMARPLPQGAEKGFLQDWNDPYNPVRVQVDTVRAHAEKVEAAGNADLAERLRNGANTIQQGWNQNWIDRHFETWVGDYHPTDRVSPAEVSAWRQLTPEERASLPRDVQRALLHDDISNSRQVLDPTTPHLQQMPRSLNTTRKLIREADAQYALAHDQLNPNAPLTVTPDAPTTLPGDDLRGRFDRLEEPGAPSTPEVPPADVQTPDPVGQRFGHLELGEGTGTVGATPDTPQPRFTDLDVKPDTQPATPKPRRTTAAQPEQKGGLILQQEEKPAKLTTKEQPKETAPKAEQRKDTERLNESPKGFKSDYMIQRDDAYNKARQDYIDEHGSEPPAGYLEKQRGTIDKLTEPQREGVTGLLNNESLVRTLDRANEHVKKTGEKAHFYSVDLKNLGGLNEALGHSGGDQTLRDIVNIIREEMEPLGAHQSHYKVGGDEFGGVLVGQDPATIQKALERVQRRVQEYNDTHVADVDGKKVAIKDIPHTKPGRGGQRGTGIEFHVEQITGEGKGKAVLDKANDAVEAKKKEASERALAAQEVGQRAATPKVADATPKVAEETKPPVPVQQQPEEKKAEALPPQVLTRLEDVPEDFKEGGSSTHVTQGEALERARARVRAKEREGLGQTIRLVVTKAGDGRKVTTYRAKRGATSPVTSPVTSTATQETAPQETQQETPQESAHGLRSGMEQAVTEIQGKLTEAFGRVGSQPIFKNNPELMEFIGKHLGGSIAGGNFTTQDAYDIMETAVNRLVRDLPLSGLRPDQALDSLTDILKLLPTQTARTKEKVEFQQFSTPPHLAYAAAYLLQPKEGDTILEPSAGTGSLVAPVSAMQPKAEIVTNEIDAQRGGLLKSQGYTTHNKDAERLNSTLPQEVRPTAIIMNPPFSATGGRVSRHSNEFGMRHLEQALKRLAPGGRLVAIMGRGMGMDKAGAAEFWGRIKKDYNVRVNVPVNGEEYRKYGTSFDNQLIVIDKDGPTTEVVHTGGKDTLKELLEDLHGKGLLRRPTAARQEAAPTVAGGATAGSTGAGVGTRGEVAPSSGTGTGSGRSSGSDVSTREDTRDGTGAGVSQTQPRSEPQVTPSATGTGTGAQTTLDTGERVAEEELPRRGLSRVLTPEDLEKAQRFVMRNWNRSSFAKSKTRTLQNLVNYLRSEPQQYVAKNIMEELGVTLKRYSDEDWTKHQAQQERAWETPAQKKKRESAEKKAAAAEAKKSGKTVEAAGTTSTEKTIDAVTYASGMDNLKTAQAGQNEADADDAAAKLNLEPQKPKESEGSGFVDYQPFHKVDGKPHPGHIVQTAVMAAVEPPPITSKLSLKPETINSGAPSQIQLEAVHYIEQRWNQHLGSGKRAGFLLGDGTGVGKNITIASAIANQWEQGQRKFLWLSVNQGLFKDAKEALEMIGYGHIPIYLVNSFKGAEALQVEEGIIFSTYNTLIHDFKKTVPGKYAGQTRRAQIADWLNKDSPIVYDESHKMKNAMVTGKGKPSKTAIETGILDGQLPDAKVLYSSATGATEVRNLAYMSRLGLWGLGTSFPGGVGDFITDISSRGIGAMEVIAQDLKSIGAYVSRNLSYEGVTYDEHKHKLTEEDRDVYNTAARIMQRIMADFEAAVETTNMGGGARSKMNNQFWSTHQRFFRTLLTSLKTPALIENVRESLKNNKSVIISLIGTNEGKEEQKAAEAAAEGIPLDELDFSPKEVLIDLVKQWFPTQNWVEEEIEDEEGRTRTIKTPVFNQDGTPELNPEALAAQQALLQEVSKVYVPENPLDQILEAFGHNNVAEISGRKKRRERRNGKVERVSRGGSAPVVNKKEEKAFQSGQKRVVVITKAGDTGISLHSSLSQRNQQQRDFYMHELPWSADSAMQTLGRGHRTNQKFPPRYILMSTNAGGEVRFSSTIARRLGQLGALTRGQRGAAAGKGDKLAAYNFENAYGEGAVGALYVGLIRRILGHQTPLPALNEITSNGARLILENMGLLRADEEGLPTISKEAMSDVPKFLNRVLALELHEQNARCDDYQQVFEGMIRAAKDNGEFDEGISDLRAVSSKVVLREKIDTGAQFGKTEHVQVEAEQEIVRFPYSDLVKWRDELVERGGRMNLAIYSADNLKNKFVRHTVSGEIAYAEPIPTMEKGNRYALHRTRQFRSRYMNEEELLKRWEFLPVTNDDWTTYKEEWTKQTEALPKTQLRQYHYISGTLLPIWRTLVEQNNGRFKISRVTTDDGTRVVGVEVPEDQVTALLGRLNLSVGGAIRPADIYDSIVNDLQVVELQGNMRLALRTVFGERAIEVLRVSPSAGKVLERLGVKSQGDYQGNTRYWIPTGTKTLGGSINSQLQIELLDKILKQFPLQGTRDAAAPSTAVAYRRERGPKSESKKTGGNQAKATPLKQVGENAFEIVDEYTDLETGERIDPKDVVRAKEQGWNELVPLSENDAKAIAEAKVKPGEQIMTPAYYSRQSAPQEQQRSGPAPAAAAGGGAPPTTTGTQQTQQPGPDPNQPSPDADEAARRKKLRKKLYRHNKLYRYEEELELEFQEDAAGVDQEKLGDIMKKKLQTAKNYWTRDFEHLPRGPEHAEFLAALRRMNKGKEIASTQAIMDLDSVLHDLTPEEYDLFKHAVHIEDLNEEIVFQQAQFEEQFPFKDPADAPIDEHLPGAWTEEAVARHLPEVRDAVKAHAKVVEALRRRKEMMNRVTAEYSRSMQRAIGKLPGFKRAHYFRHQILEFQTKNGVKGTGEKLEAPTRRGFLQRRKGSGKRYNTSYIEAEYEVLSQMAYDTEVFNLIKLVKDRYDITDSLKRAAIEANDLAIMPYFEELAGAENIQRIADGKNPLTGEDMYRRILNWQQAAAFDKLGRLAIKGVLPGTDDPRWAPVIETIADSWRQQHTRAQAGVGQVSGIPESFHKDLFAYAAWLLKEHGGDVGTKGASMLFKGVWAKKKFIKEKLGAEFVTHLDLMRELYPGYVEWRPDDSNVVFRAYTLPEKVAESIQAQLLEGAKVTADQLGTARVFGGKRRALIIPKEVAATLDSFAQVEPQLARRWLDRMTRKGTGIWKVWTLLNPFQAIPYQLRNTIGDFDAVFVGNPHSATKLLAAAKDLRAFWKRREINPERADLFKSWLKQGGLQGTLQAQEGIGSMTNLDYLSRLAEKKPGMLRRAYNWTMQKALVPNDMREAWLRYATYLSYMDQLKKSTNGRPRNWGASIPSEVMALATNEEKAWALSNQLLGAYDEVSLLGQGLRENLFPFWSWKEVNSKRWYRLAQNSGNSPRMKMVLGKRLLGKVATPYVYYTVGSFAAKALGMSSLLYWYNNTFHPELEKNAPQYVRGRPHLIVVNPITGEPAYFTKLGNLPDLLSNFNGDDAMGYREKYLNGRMTIKDILVDMAKEIPNQVYQQVGPLKGVVEAIGGVTTYPSVWDRRPIRDRGEALARALSLDKVYNLFSGKPERRTTLFGKKVSANWMKTIGLTEYDPEETNYYEMLGVARDWKRKEGLPVEPGADTSDKGNQLYYHKQAKRFGDNAAAHGYLVRYANRAGTDKGYQSSMQRLDPLYGFSDRQKRRFLSSLSREDQRRLMLAYYHWQTMAAPDLDMTTWDPSWMGDKMVQSRYELAKPGETEEQRKEREALNMWMFVKSATKQVKRNIEKQTPLTDIRKQDPELDKIMKEWEQKEK